MLDCHDMDGVPLAGSGTERQGLLPREGEMFRKGIGIDRGRASDIGIVDFCFGLGS